VVDGSPEPETFILSLPILHCDVVLAPPWHFYGGFLFEKPNNVRSRPQLSGEAFPLQEEIQCGRIIFALLGKPPVNRNSTGPGGILWISKSMQEVVVLLPSDESRSVGAVEVRSKTLPRFEFHIRHHPMQFNAVMFGVLHPQP
jgi:hypothetical protein